jgi:CheY-like chemotaxis protein
MAIQYKSLLASALRPSRLRHAPHGREAAGDASAEQGLPSTRATGANSASLNILLAEDNPVNQDVASRMLGRLGHEIDLAVDGFEAVQKAKARLYDVILMDMQMPDMDGVQATLIIRKLPPPHGQVPIVALTANAFPTDRQACLDAGMNDFVSKPVTRDKLAAALQPWAGCQATASPEVAVVSPARHALVDEDHFARVARELGTEILGDLLAMFRASLPQLLGDLQSALERDDPVAADRALHRLKGSAANFGFVGCQAMCDEIRAQIPMRGLAAVGEALPMLRETCRETERLSRAGARALEGDEGGPAAA